VPKTSRLQLTAGCISGGQRIDTVKIYYSVIRVYDVLNHLMIMTLGDIDFSYFMPLQVQYFRKYHRLNGSSIPVCINGDTSFLWEPHTWLSDSRTKKFESFLNFALIITNHLCNSVTPSFFNYRYYPLCYCYCHHCPYLRLFLILFSQLFGYTAASVE